MRRSAHFCLLGIAALVGLIGCGAPVEGEDWDEEGADEIGELGQALSESCGSFAPQQTFTGSMGFVSASVATQGQGCDGNSFIFDINAYNAGQFLAPGVSPAVFPEIASQCTSTSIQYFVWEKTSSNVVFLGKGTTTGSFDPFFGCFITGSSPVTLVSNRDYRFGVSVRRPDNVVQDLTVSQVRRPR